MRKIIPVVAIVAISLAGCRAEAELGIDVESTGAGTFGFEIAVDEEFQDLIESTGQDIDELVGSLPPGATALEPRQEGGLTVYGFTQAFADPAEATNLVSQGTAGVDVQASSFDLSVADGGAALDASLDLPNAAEQAGEFGGLAQSLEEVFSVVLRVHLPGEVVDSNADRTLDDGSLVWDIPLTGGVLEVEARSEAGGDDSVVLPIAITAAVVALAAGLWAFSRRRSGGASAVEAVPVPSAPTSLYGDVTTPAVYHEAVAGATDDVTAAGPADDAAMAPTPEGDIDPHGEPDR
ncbi:MAG: hypothetical protein H0V96_01505 [Acidimicrobiia bacterium]|nr:hypothetical protein [Acidimicrobiia bacterium]